MLPQPLLPFVIAALGAAASRPAAETAAPRGTCDTTARPVPLGSILDTLFLTLRPANGTNTPLPSPWGEDAVQGIAAQLVLPRPVALPIWVAARERSVEKRWTGRDTVRATVANSVFALVTPGGHLDGPPSLAASALDVRADSAVLRAVRAADSAGVFAAPPIKNTQKIAIYVGLGTRERDRDPETGRPREDAAYATAASTLSVPLALVRRDVLVVSGPTAPLQDPSNAFVDSILRGLPQTDDHVRIDFVLGGDGVAVPSTVVTSRFVNPTAGQFAARQIAGQRFTPSQVAGCGVPTLVRINANFRFQLPARPARVPY